MSKLSRNEISQNAIAFSRRWEGVTDERAEAQSFWNEFLEVFGVNRRLVNATFEETVRSFKDTAHRIDFFWKGRFLAEHKSAGADLSKARSQAFQYIAELAAEGRDDEIPRYIAVSDFARIVLYDLEPEDQGELFRNMPVTSVEIPLQDLYKHVSYFAFLTGQKTHSFGEEDPANIEAAQIMADLHDTIAEGGYPVEQLERLMVRLLFCMFAEDTGIFDTGIFQLYLENNTQETGNDLGGQLFALFQTLNTAEDKRNANLPEELSDFPYINGELFKETLSLSSFNRDMRNALIASCRFDWAKISPAVFGSLFQGIMDDKERRQIGAHYTSERDILKVIQPLFMDELRAEFENIKTFKNRTQQKNQLNKFQEKLAGLKFLDPACGCGNFLVIGYRELRRLELEVLVEANPITRTELMDIGELNKLSQVDVDQFYGIEYLEWPARIAETALWLTDHQMNIELSEKFGNIFQRIPLKASPHIQCANALRMDWNDLLPAEECSYVMGNPPFVGAKFQSAEQKAEVRDIAHGIKGVGLLDYVTMWYFKASDYVMGTGIRCAFVSTNSISQGEQVGVLWQELFNRGVKIQFAHRTFSWQSEAKGKAHVHVVIVGFGFLDVEEKYVFEYETLISEPHALLVANINPYLIEGSDICITNQSKPISKVPEIGIGNKPIDGGNYLFTEDEKRAFLKLEPEAEQFFHPWIGSREFINGFQRWCLWLGDANPQQLRNLPESLMRIERVKDFRLKSDSAPTNKLAQTPRRFHVENFPESSFLLIPEVSSERRNYIPIGYLEPPTLCSNLVKIFPDATPYHFGILTSAMHMGWMRQVCGRLKSDFRYSA